MVKRKEKKKKDDSSGLVFVGIFFLGMAGGFIMGNVPAGVFVGLGAGFLGMFYVRPQK